ncbi:MAG TPA: methyltransferase domain-containing protein [Patescibacteria group bacterium]|nr:methyltransferase domain-containing protein [Patescibacteria group bacterium]
MDCFRWVAKNLSEKEIKGKKIIEVGSYDVNGSLRYIIELLKPKEYIGVDIERGSGVDIICSAEKLIERFGKNSFDVVISTCVLEHVRDWKTSVSNIKNVCRENGVIIIIVPSQWGFHPYPQDYWRFSRKDMQKIFQDCDIQELDEDINVPSLVYAKFVKPRKFVEKDLSLFALYSIITNRKIKTLTDKDFYNFHYRFLTLRHKIMKLILKLGIFLFRIDRLSNNINAVE